MTKYAGPLALALLAGAAGPLAADETFTQHQHNGTVYVKVISPPSINHWQTYFDFTVPQGQNLLFSDQCPTNAPNVVNGAFSPNTAAKVGLSLVANYRPASDRTKWTWAINWPSGAPAGSHISFNVYCLK